MDNATVMITLGALFLAGLASDAIGRRARLPRVTLLLLCGLAVGEAGFDLMPDELNLLYDFLAITALTMVAFLLGGAFELSGLKSRGAAILSISLSIVVTTMAMVGVGLWAMGLPFGLALLLGAIASATAPAATQDAIHQASRSGPFTQTLSGIVAIDDAWGLIAFSFALVIAAPTVGGMDSGLAEIATGAGYEIGGAVLLGLAVGFPGAMLTGRLSPGVPLQTEALGLVFLTAGFALWLEVSYLLAGMVAGAVIVNRARHHEYAFHEIETLQWPFMLLFFILAGASLDPAALAELGMLGLAFIALRTISRLIGGWVGAVIAGAPRAQRPLFGLALLPQAGVAVGMALAAGERFPEWKAQIMTITIGSTVAFELLGPALTIWAVRRAVPASPPSE